MKSHYAKWAVLLLLRSSLSLNVGAAQIETATDDGSSFSTTPRESVLLLGDHTVARTSHLTQRYFPAGKHPANPVMRRTEPWEGTGPYVFLNRLLQDEQSGQLRLWYIGFHPESNEYGWGYATSSNGLNWTKPNLGQMRFGSMTNKAGHAEPFIEERLADGTGYASHRERKGNR